MRDVARPIVVVWDRLGTHRSRVTESHVAAQAGGLTLEYLPAYAPELNPLEYLCTTFRSKDLVNHCPDGVTELADHLRR